MNLPPCLVCRRPVLELPGEFHLLARYELEPGDAATAAEAFGSIHTRCFVDFPFRASWVERHRQRLKALGWPLLASIGDVEVLSDPRGIDRVFFDGRDWLALPVCALERVRAGAPEAEVDVREFNVDLRGYEHILPELRRGCSLGVLVDVLGLAPTLADAGVVARGQVVPDAELEAEWRGAWVVLRLRVRVRLTTGQAAAARAERG